MPFYDLVPKDPAKNLRWRHRVYKAAASDKELQRCLRYACENDFLFHVSAFCWLFEPRQQARVLPFVPWPHQEGLLLKLNECCGVRSVKARKSRGEGWTWSYLMVYLYRWWRDPQFAAGLMTRNEKLVDSSVDPDALLNKLRWQLEQWPEWFCPEYRYMANEHAILNEDLDGTIVGYAATKEMGIGGRKTSVALDEFNTFPSPDDEALLGAIFHTTDSVFLVSSFYRAGGAYYDALHTEDEALLIESLWYDNPTKNRYLYRIQDGRAVAARPAEQAKVDEYREVHKELLARLARRGFQPDGHTCSPWYDRKCNETGMTPRQMAQQVDCNPEGLASACFHPPLLQRMEKEQARRPLAQGRFDYDAERCRMRDFYAAQDGELKLWVTVGLGWMLPFGEYVVGADVAAGLGGDLSSASTACVLNRATGEQVAEFSSIRVRPHEFARLVVALCRWFNDAFLIWDAGGPTGGTFREEVLERIGYFNVYRHKSEAHDYYPKETMRTGFVLNNDDQRQRLFDAMASAWDDGRFLPRSTALLKECRQFEYDPKTGKIVHQAAKKSEVGANKGKLHGDLVIAAALAWRGLEDQPIIENSSREETAKLPEYTHGWLIQQHERGQKGDVAERSRSRNLDKSRRSSFTPIGVDPRRW